MFDGFLWYRPRSIKCPAGTWTVIIKTCFIHFPAVFQVNLSSESGLVQGQFEKQSGIGMWPIWAPRNGELKQTIKFERGLLDDYFCIRIKPDVDMTAEIKML